MATSVRALLPRVGRAELLGWLGADLEQPAGSFDLLPDAAAAAVCLPALVGHSRAAREARRAAVQLVGRELSTRELSSLLGVGERTVKRLRTSHASAALLRAVDLQLRLRHAHACAVSGEEPIP